MTVNDTDKFLVNRSGSSYHLEAQNLMAELQDDDLMLVNRSGKSYKATGAEIKGSLSQGPSATINKPYIVSPSDGAGGQVTPTSDPIYEYFESYSVSAPISWERYSDTYFNTLNTIGGAETGPGHTQESRFVAAKANDNQLRFSWNGIEWTTSDATGATFKTCDSGMVEYNENCFVFAGKHPDGTNGIIVSTNDGGVTYGAHTLRPYGNRLAYPCIASDDNGGLVFVASNGTSGLSRPGTGLVASDTKKGNTAGTPTCLTYGEGAYVGFMGGQLQFTTDEATTWQNAGVSDSGTVIGANRNSNRWVYGTSSGNIFYSDSYTGPWTQAGSGFGNLKDIETNHAGQWVVVNTTGKIYISLDDGKNWQQATTSDNNSASLRFVRYSNGFWLTITEGSSKYYQSGGGGEMLLIESAKNFDQFTLNTTVTQDDGNASATLIGLDAAKKAMFIQDTTGTWTEGRRVLGPTGPSPIPPINVSGLKLEGSEFESSDGSLVHTASDWQIANFDDTDYEFPVAESLSDTSNLVEWDVVPQLNTGRQYRCRVKYKSNSISSEWSDDAVFFTALTTLGLPEEEETPQEIDGDY